MKKKIFFVVISLIIVLSIIRITYMNKTASEYKLTKTYCQTGEQISDNDFAFRIKDYRIIDATSMKSEYDFTDDKIKDDEIYYAIVDIECEYSGKEDFSSPSFMDMHLASNAWSNGVNLQATTQINKNGFKCNKNMKEVFTIVFSLRKDTFSNSGWKDVRIRDYQLVMMKFPHAMIMEL